MNRTKVAALVLLAGAGSVMAQQPWAAFGATTTTVAGSAAAAIVVTPAAQHPGGTVKVTAGGFAKSSTAQVLVAGRSTTVKTSTTGTVAASVLVPWQAVPGVRSVQVIQGARTVKGAVRVRTDWRMAGGSPSASGVNYYEKQLTTDNVDELRLRWRAALPEANGGSPSALTMTTLADAGYVCSNDGGANKIDLTTGKLLWHLGPYDDVSSRCAQGGAYNDGKGTVWFGRARVDDETGPPVPNATVSVSDVAIPYGDLIITGGSGRAASLVRAFNAATGEQVWRAVPSGGGTLMIGSQLFTSDGGNVRELNPLTGELLNSFYAVDSAHDSSIVDIFSDGKTLFVAGTPDIDPKTGLGTSGWSAFDPRTGKLLWRVPSEKYGGGHATIDATAFYYMTQGDTFGEGTQLVARSNVDGHKLWSAHIGSTPVLQTAFYAVANGLIYVTDSWEGVLKVISTTDGKVVATYTNLPEITSTVVINGHLYALTSTGVYDYALPDVP